MVAIAASFYSSKAVLFTPRLAPQHGGFVFPVGITEACVQLWATRYIDKDVWGQVICQCGLERDGQAYLGDDLVPRQEFLASPFYREFLSNHGIAFLCTGIIFSGSPDLPAIALSIYRDVSDPPFDQGDVAWMKLLVAHVSRAMGLMLRLETARVQNAALLASFDRLNFGVALLNEAMEVLHLNQAAKGVLARGDGLSLNAQRQLDGCTGNAKSSLQNISSWLKNVRDTPLPEQPHFLQGAAVERENHPEGNGGGHKPPGKKYYDLQCVPLSITNAWFAQQQDARYVVFITEPQAVKLPDNAKLDSLYGLTATQAKVTREFARGACYKEAARRLLISEDSVRSHIKEIYRKTRVNRQADLVHLILSISQSAV